MVKEIDKKDGAVENTQAPATENTQAPATEAPAASTPVKSTTTKPKVVKPAEDKKEMVQVDKNVLAQVLKKQEDMEGEITGLKKDNLRLTAVADKSRLGWYDEQNGDGALIHTYRVGIYVDYNNLDKEDNPKKKIVLGWKMVKDEVRLEAGVLKENQIFKLYLDEGEGEEPSDVEVNILQFAREIQKVKGELVKEAKTKDGETKTLRFEDGREIEFDVRFLN